MFILFFSTRLLLLSHNNSYLMTSYDKKKHTSSSFFHFITFQSSNRVSSWPIGCWVARWSQKCGIVTFLANKTPVPELTGIRSTLPCILGIVTNSSPPPPLTLPLTTHHQRKFSGLKVRAPKLGTQALTSVFGLTHSCTECKIVHFHAVEVGVCFACFCAYIFDSKLDLFADFIVSF